MSGVYSLVNVPCLVRDLSRHPRGAGLAADLLRAAALDPAAFSSLDTVRLAADAATRRDALAEQMRVEPRALQVLAATRDMATTSGIDAWTAAVDVLEAAPMGSLGRPWRRWLTATGHAVPSVDAAVADVVVQLRDASPQQLQQAAQGLRRQRAEGWSWAIAMHDACWAVHLTGRETVALTAQLHALRALLAATPAGTKPSPDTCAAVVAAVHARVVADVLAGDVLAALTAPLDAALHSR